MKWIHLAQNTVVSGSGGDGKEHLSFVIFVEIVDNLNNCKLLRNGSALIIHS